VAPVTTGFASPITAAVEGRRSTRALGIMNNADLHASGSVRGIGGSEPEAGGSWGPAGAVGEGALEALAAGEVLDAKYRLVQRLAAGSMGTVWYGQHLALEAPVAIKLLSPVDDSSGDARRRFLREARIVSALRSPNVVQVLDYGVVRGTPYLVMELLNGESLAQRLHRVGRLSPARVTEILCPLGDALGRAHALGVVHRDLKPDNIFLVQEAARQVPKLLDFGVAKVHEGRFGVTGLRNTRAGELVGTPHYMSPEQARGSEALDHRSDVWAFGVIAFECLLGYHPFVAPNLVSLLLLICSQPLPVPSAFGVVPPGFDAWFARACARAPEERFPGMQAALQELRRVCLTPETLAAVPSAGQVARSAETSRERRATFVFAVLASFAAALLVSWLAGGRPAEATGRGSGPAYAAGPAPQVRARELVFPGHLRGLGRRWGTSDPSPPVRHWRPLER
jgi:eukaryotic-like serine/threonine-protein kinase